MDAVTNPGGGPANPGGGGNGIPGGAPGALGKPGGRKPGGGGPGIPGGPPKGTGGLAKAGAPTIAKPEFRQNIATEIWLAVRTWWHHAHTATSRQSTPRTGENLQKRKRVENPSENAIK